MSGPVSKLREEAEDRAKQLRAFWVERGFLLAEFRVVPGRINDGRNGTIYEIVSNLTNGMPPRRQPPPAAGDSRFSTFRRIF